MSFRPSRRKEPEVIIGCIFWILAFTGMAADSSLVCLFNCGFNNKKGNQFNSLGIIFAAKNPRPLDVVLEAEIENIANLIEISQLDNVVFITARVVLFTHIFYPRTPSFLDIISILA